MNISTKQAESRLIAAQIAEWVASGGCITVAENAGPFERFNKEHWSREQIQARREKLANTLRKVV